MNLDTNKRVYDGSILEQLITQLSPIDNNLKSILQAEQEAFIDRDLERLNKLTDQKQSQLEKLYHLTDKINSQLLTLGFNESLSTSKFLSDINLHENTILAWQKHIDAVEECKIINRNNSTLISFGIKQTLQALNFLRTNNSDENGHSYSKHGLNGERFSYGMNIKA